MVPIRTRIPIRRRTWFAGLLGLLAVLALSLSQCRLVGDRLTGVGTSLSRSAASDCLAQCQKTAQEALEVENALHIVRVRACRSDPLCLKAEQARHTAALESIHAARKACMGGCHRQGRGQGGE